MIFRVASFTKRTLMRAVGLSLWIYVFLVREIASSDIDCTANTQEACEQCQEVNVSVDCYWKNNRCNQLVWTDMKQHRPRSRVNRIAITSCYYHGSTANVALRHLGEQNYDILLELGDNVYSDTLDSCTQRRKYISKRSTPDYSALTTRTPIYATWDDHDYCTNNKGRHCSSSFKIESQKNFLRMFGVPLSDERWNAQEGVYSKTMFGTETNRNRVHVITLDSRYFRSATSPVYGPCEGASSTMLGDTQWRWLEAALETETDVLIIANGVQILPPLAATSGQSSKPKESYCAYDSNNNTFDLARQRLGELGNSETDWCPPTMIAGGHFGCTARGSEYEQWSEMPAERERLLRLVQSAIYRGKARVVVFASGDKHWAEISSKRLYESEPGRNDDCMVYEVTGSGLGTNWNGAYLTPFFNDNRHPSTWCDHQRDAQYTNRCVFPFSYNGKTHFQCTFANNENTPWCAHEVDSNGIMVSGQWGQCGTLVNHAPSNYAEIEVDFAREEVLLKIWAPGTTESRNGLAETITIPFDATFPPTLAPNNYSTDDPEHGLAIGLGVGISSLVLLIVASVYYKRRKKDTTPTAITTPFM